MHVVKSGYLVKGCAIFLFGLNIYGVWHHMVALYNRAENFNITYWLISAILFVLLSIYTTILLNDSMTLIRGDEKGISYVSLFSREFFPWDQICKYKIGRTSLFLSFEQGKTIECFSDEGMLVKINTNKNGGHEFLELVKSKISVIE